MSTTSVPPRYLPTLTDVVPPTSRAYAPQFENNFKPSAGVNSGGSTNGFVQPVRSDDQLVKRVMQQVDVLLERRLREALGRVILEQTEALAPKLRGEIEQVVRESVAQAVAQELAGR